jgi:hypothetical protein
MKPEKRPPGTRQQVRIGDEDKVTIDYCIKYLTDTYGIDDFSSMVRFAINRLREDIESGKLQKK